MRDKKFTEDSRKNKKKKLNLCSIDLCVYTTTSPLLQKEEILFPSDLIPSWTVLLHFLFSAVWCFLIKLMNLDLAVCVGRSVGPAISFLIYGQLIENSNVLAVVSFSPSSSFSSFFASYLYFLLIEAA